MEAFLFLLAAVITLFTGLVYSIFEIGRLDKLLDKYKSASSIEGLERELESDISSKRRDLVELSRQEANLKNQINNLQGNLQNSKNENYLHLLELYEPKYNFSSNEYELKLAAVKSAQKEMRQKGIAVACQSEWIVRGSKKEGQRMIQDLLTLIKTAFEIQCNYKIQEIKYGNVKVLEKKIIATFEEFNKRQFKSEVQHHLIAPRIPHQEFDNLTTSSVDD